MVVQMQHAKIYQHSDFGHQAQCLSTESGHHVFRREIWWAKVTIFPTEDTLRKRIFLNQVQSLPFMVVQMQHANIYQHSDFAHHCQCLSTESGHRVFRREVRWAKVTFSLPKIPSAENIFKTSPITSIHGCADAACQNIPTQ